MTRTVLDVLAAAEERATPGPWAFSDSSDRRGRKGEFRAPNPHNGFMLVGPWIDDADPALIALLRNHAADLIAVARAAQDIKPAQPREGMSMVAQAIPDDAVIRLKMASRAFLADAPEDGA